MSLKATQQALAAMLLKPVSAELPALAGIPAERLNIYTGLLRSTIDGCLSSIYPHTKRILTQKETNSTHWKPLVEEFRRMHPCTSYILLDAVEAFPVYLATHASITDYPFLPEVALYEWLEAVVQNAPDPVIPAHLNASVPGINDLARLRPLWNGTGIVQSFAWPVTKILDTIRTLEDISTQTLTFSPDPQQVLIYRDPLTMKARFFVLGELTARLLETLSGEVSYRAGLDALIAQIPRPDAMPENYITQQALSMLNHCLAQGILLGSVPI